MSLRRTILTGLVLVVGMAVRPHATEAQSVLYVDDTATGANNGSSWCDAYVYLQDALAAAGGSTEIRVEQGVYKPDQGGGQTTGDREASFQLLNGVALKGGYAGCGESDPNARDTSSYETILSGDLESDDADETEIDCCTPNAGEGCNSQSCLDLVCERYPDVDPAELVLGHEVADRPDLKILELHACLPDFG